ncbi:Surfactin synthase subunit 2 [Kordia antarctica]|uniref:Surfactin synthase subunit 2 n=1 Tax=Kordia antarctica TaxID=1218801 RepID=A0A7L4ZHN6_9FLAO|nr:non-ribosomal peptide synthetase [Kordia antarctica]QHI35444.1 Surfactin synthase subunit 2 [Kordia antarctica]
MVDLINKLATQNIHVFLESGVLKVSAVSDIDPLLIKEIRNSKEQLIQYLSQFDAGQEDNIPLTMENTSYPLSSSQYRIWLLSQLEEGSIAYNMYSLNTINGEIDKLAIETAFKKIVKRHEILRTVFKENNEGELRQYIKNMNEIDTNIRYLDCSNKSIADIQKNAQKEFIASFDLELGLLVRLSLYKVESDKYWLLLGMHHIISDGWSMGVFIKEFLEIYEAITKNRKENLPELTIQYKDYAVWQQNLLNDTNQKQQKTFWTDQLNSTLPVLNLPTDYPRPPIKTYNGAKKRKVFNSETFKRFNAFCYKEEGTLFIGLLTILNIFLYKCTNQTDFIIGTPVAGRNSVDLEHQLGCYINTLALRNSFTSKTSFLKLFHDIKKNTISVFENDQYPFDELVKSLDLKQDASRTPIFDVMLLLQNDETAEISEDTNKDITIGSFDVAPKVYSKFDITFGFEEYGDDLVATIEYNTDLFKETTILRFFDHIETLMEACTSNSKMGINALNFLNATEKEAVVNTFNPKLNWDKKWTSINQLFEAQVQKKSHQIAVVVKETEISYKTLNERACQFANFLSKKYKIVHGDIIGVHAERDEWLMTIILGIQKLGAVYVPIEIDYPQERIDYIASNCKSKIIINTTTVQEFVSSIDTYEKSKLSTATTQDDITYIIYTSGSTGQPKGVKISHKNVSSFISWARSEFSLDDIDTVLATTSVSFDISIFEFFYTLCSGKKLVLFKNVFEIEATDLKEGKILLNTVPSAMDILRAKQIDFRAFTAINLAGEQLKESHLKGVDLQKVKVRNLYGPTENTIYTTTAIITDKKAINIGAPVDNTNIYILSDTMNFQPVGVPGELCITGLGLSPGYINNEEITNEKFIDNPYVKGQKLYKTGDIGRWLPNGTIQLYGRKDFQVKIRGYRIELGEIESKLNQYNTIKTSVVIAKRIKEQMELIAYIVPEKELEISELRNYLGKSLPQYMLPNYFVKLKELPLLTNGKLDRSKLPNPEGTTLESEDIYEAPTTEIEELLVQIYEYIFPNRRIGIQDSFFRLGGDSIKSIQIVSRLKQNGYKVDLKDILQFPVIKELSHKVFPLTKKIDQEIIVGKLSLSPIQKWFLNTERTSKHHFNQSVILKSNHVVSREAVEAVIAKLVLHHDALRMVFYKEKGIWIQENEGNTKGYIFEEKEVSNDEDYKAYCDAFQANFVLEEGPLFKVALLKNKNEEYLLFTAHHLIIDGVSWRILLEDFTNLHSQYLQGESFAMPLKTHSFGYWVDQLTIFSKTNHIQKQLPYWTQLVNNAKHADKLPIDINTTDNFYGDSSIASFALSEELTNLLLTKANEAYSTSVNDVLLASFSAALLEVFGMQKVFVNMEGHGREQIEDDLDITRTVGWFTTLFPVYINVEKKEAEDHLVSVKETLHRIPDKGIGYGILKYISNTIETISSEITFNYLGDFGSNVPNDNKESNHFEYTNVYKGNVLSSTMERDALLDISGMVVAGILSIQIGYSAKQFYRETIQGLLAAYEKNLTDLIQTLSNREKTITPVDLTYKKLNVDQFKKLEKLFQKKEN